MQDVEFQMGDEVKIIGGWMSDFSGTIIGIDEYGALIGLKDIAPSRTQVTVHFEQIRKLNA